MKLRSRAGSSKGLPGDLGPSSKAAHSHGWKLVMAVGLGQLASLHMGCLSALTAWWPAGPGFESHSLSLLPHLLSTQTNSLMVGGDHTRV